MSKETIAAGKRLEAALEEHWRGLSQRGRIVVQDTTKSSMFRLWLGPWLITVCVFGRLFQVKRVRDELFSQRNDRWRIRLFGLSIKLFGK